MAAYDFSAGNEIHVTRVDQDQGRFAAGASSALGQDDDLWRLREPGWRHGAPATDLWAYVVAAGRSRRRGGRVQAPSRARAGHGLASEQVRLLRFASRAEAEGPGRVGGWRGTPARVPGSSRAR